VKRALGTCDDPENWPEGIWSEDACRIAAAASSSAGSNIPATMTTAAGKPALAGSGPPRYLANWTDEALRDQIVAALAAEPRRCKGLDLPPAGVSRRAL
jgi:hypothetical protein